MSILEKLRFNLWDPTDMVVSLVNKWEPTECKSEKDYEKSLYNYLHDSLKEIQVTKQYAKGRIRADIVVGDKIIIELKNNLDSTGKYQRLIGQLMEYEEWNGSVIVLLAGKTDENLLKEFRKYVEKKKTGSLDDDRFKIIIK